LQRAAKRTGGGLDCNMGGGREQAAAASHGCHLLASAVLLSLLLRRVGHRQSVLVGMCMVSPVQCRTVATTCIGMWYVLGYSCMYVVGRGVREGTERLGHLRGSEWAQAARPGLV